MFDLEMNWSEHTKIQRKEIQKQIEELQEKLKELEKTKSPVEEAYKKVYGKYPVKDVSEELTSKDSWNVISWSAFQKGYEQSQKGYKVGEYQPTPQTPEQVADGLKEAFREAVKQGVVSSADEPKTEETRNPDEIIARDINTLHMEMMNDDSMWIGIYRKNGQIDHLNVTVKGKKLSTLWTPNTGNMNND